MRFAAGRVVSSSYLFKVLHARCYTNTLWDEGGIQRAKEPQKREEDHHAATVGTGTACQCGGHSVCVVMRDDGDCVLAVAATEKRLKVCSCNRVETFGCGGVDCKRECSVETPPAACDIFAVNLTLQRLMFYLFTPCTTSTHALESSTKYLIKVLQKYTAGRAQRTMDKRQSSWTAEIQLRASAQYHLRTIGLRWAAELVRGLGF